MPGADRWEPGTVNVDSNEPMRAALAGVHGPEALSVEIGSDTFGVRTRNAEVIERRVPVPERWVRGFAEVEVTAADPGNHPTIADLRTHTAHGAEPGCLLPRAVEFR